MRREQDQSVCFENGCIVFSGGSKFWGLHASLESFSVKVKPAPGSARTRYSRCVHVPLAISTKWPAIAAAAAMTGLTRCVRLSLALPSFKISMEVLAARSREGARQDSSRCTCCIPRRATRIPRPGKSFEAFGLRLRLDGHRTGTTSAPLRFLETCLPGNDARGGPQII